MKRCEAESVEEVATGPKRGLSRKRNRATKVGNRNTKYTLEDPVVTEKIMRFIGFDVHKDTIAVAATNLERGEGI